MKLNYFALPNWIKNYQKSDLNPDIIAGLIVGVVVIPQSLGYALLAGLPPVYGLYASIVPVLVYAYVGSSSVNAVGAVSLTAVMTAQALSNYQHLPSEVYASLATVLALLVGIFLTLASFFRLGWIVQFISRGVSAGFVSGTAILIFFSQIKVLTGIGIVGNNVTDNLISLVKNYQQFHLPTFIVGFISVIILWLNRKILPNYLKKLPLSENFVSNFCRMIPLFLVALAIVASEILGFAQLGIRLVAEIPHGLPSFQLPNFSPEILIKLLPSALLIALISFISSQAVAGNFARKYGQKFDANQELKGLGLANLIGAFFQSFAVTGGLSRTAINTGAGAKTPLASLITVLIMALTLQFFYQIFAPLPYAILGAIIMMSIINMVDSQTFLYATKFDKLEAVVFMATLVSVLLLGVNFGLVCGILLSFLGLIWQSTRPHIAVVGQVGQTGHFRNVERHAVTRHPNILIIRIDESLFYGNAVSVRQFIDKHLSEKNYKDVVLMLSAVNHIDLTAQEMLITLNQELQKQDILLHYSEIKGPVFDILAKTPVVQGLSGQVFLSTEQAVNTLQQKYECFYYQI